MKKWLILTLTLICLFTVNLGNLNAQTYKVDTCIQIKDNINFTSNNITVYYPNSSVAISNKDMTKLSNDIFYYNFCNANYTGTYQVYFCNYDYCTEGSFDVTTNGNPAPSGIVLVIFSLLFIGFISYGIINFLEALAKTISFEMDIIDTAVMMSTYFGIWVLYYLEMNYVGNPLMDDILSIAVIVGAFTHVFMALAGFFISYIMSLLQLKQKARVTY